LGDVVELLSLSCNKCGAPLEVPAGTNFLTCSYCKSRLAIHTSGSAFYTEVLEQIDQKTTQILDKVDTLVSQGTVRWETCEIVWHRKAITWAKMGSWFEAAAIGQHGPYVAAKSEYMPDVLQRVGQYFVPKQIDSIMTEFNAFVTTLSKDGWEALSERGQFWYSVRFRRRVT
jgi:hypothetical protein